MAHRQLEKRRSASEVVVGDVERVGHGEWEVRDLSDRDSGASRVAGSPGNAAVLREVGKGWDVRR